MFSSGNRDKERREAAAAAEARKRMRYIFDDPTEDTKSTYMSPAGKGLFKPGRHSGRILKDPKTDRRTPW